MKNPFPFAERCLPMVCQWILLLGFLSAQSIGQPQNQPFDFFTTRHGLVDNHITALLHQPNGYLWIGTAGGLSRFDGQNFDNFSDDHMAPLGKIIAIKQSPDSRIWFASHQRLVYWKDNHFYEAQVFDSGIRHLEVGKDDRLWVALEEGLALCQGGTWFFFDATNSFPDFRITQIYEDREGYLWVGLRNGGIVRLNPQTKQWIHYGYDSDLPHLTTNHFLEASDGTFWIATHGGVVTWQDGQFTPAPFNDELPSPIIYRLFEDRENGLWMTASNAGAARWDGHDLITYNRNSGMASNFSIGFLQDKWGHLWLLCQSGVSIYFGGNLVPIGTDEGLQGRLMTTFQQGDDGLIWVGTTNGLNRYEEPRFKTYLHDTSDRIVQSSTSRRIFKDSKSRLWFPSFLGLGCYDGRNFLTYTEVQGLPARFILHWLEKSSGQIWVGTERGAAYLKDDVFHALEDPRLRDQVIVNMLSDKQDRLWLLLGNWHLFRQSQDLETFEEMGRFEGVMEIMAQEDGSIWLSQMAKLTKIDSAGKETTYLLETITDNQSVISRYFDPAGIWWLGTAKELIRFDGNQPQKFGDFGSGKQFGVTSIKPGANNRIWFNTIEPNSDWPLRPGYSGLGVFDGESFRHYSQQEGLHPRIAHDILVDSRGREWFLSNKGLSWLEDGKIEYLGVSKGLAGNRPYKLFWDRNDHLWIATNGGLNKRSDNLMTTLGPNDGLLDSHVYDALEDDQGAIWIRTRLGVQRYRENPNPPEIDLIGVWDGDSPLSLEPGLELAHNQNNLIFHLRGIHLGKGADQMHFSYKLQGRNKEWRGVTRESRLHFPGLRPDSYTFTVRAYSRDLTGSKQPQVFTFTIHPPWWFSIGFLISAILIGSLLSYLIYRNRLGVRLEKVRIFSELQTAHDMQLSLMPKVAPITSRLEIFGTCKPAKEVGGDYYDYFWLDEDHQELGIAIMDVAGKSMEAAIISVMASGLVCSEIGQRNAPAAILSRINFPMYQKTSKKIFTTGLVAALHTRTQKFRWANAGHMDPILIREGRHMPLDIHAKRDLPLGAMRHWEYQQNEAILQPGDLIFMYTDGLTEALNKEGKFFGTDRLVGILEDHAQLTPKALINKLLKDVEDFAGQEPQYDDITLVAIRVNPSQPDVSLT